MATSDNGTPDQYSERMAALMQCQDAMLRAIPEVRGYMWFRTYGGDAACRANCGLFNFAGSNLIKSDGSLTAAGEQ